MSLNPLAKQKLAAPSIKFLFNSGRHSSPFPSVSCWNNRRRSCLRPLSQLVRPVRGSFRLPNTTGGNRQISSRPHTSQTSRHFSSTAAAFQTIKDRSHPTGLYYHSLPPDPPSTTSSEGKVWAISILAEPPTSRESISILGHLDFRNASPAEDQQIPELVRSSPDLLRPNKKFLEFLHQVLRKEVVLNDDVLAFEAGMRGSGYAHLSDARHELMPGRIPTPDSILASAAFVDGKFCVDQEGVLNGYEINDTYRLVTKEEGPIQLREEWLDIVRKRLQEVN